MTRGTMPHPMRGVAETCSCSRCRRFSDELADCTRHVGWLDEFAANLTHKTIDRRPRLERAKSVTCDDFAMRFDSPTNGQRTLE